MSQTYIGVVIGMMDRGGDDSGMVTRANRVGQSGVAGRFRTSGASATASASTCSSASWEDAAGSSGERSSGAAGMVFRARGKDARVIMMAVCGSVLGLASNDQSHHGDLRELAVHVVRGKIFSIPIEEAGIAVVGRR